MLGHSTILPYLYLRSRVDRVFVDTNELFPFTVMDLILRLAEDRLLGFVWTDELLTEWERVIVEDGHEPRNQPRQWQPRSERLSPTADALGFRG